MFMRFDKIYCSQGSQTNGQKHTQTVASKPKAVLLSLPMFRLEMDRPAACSSRNRRSLVRRNMEGSLSRVPEEPAMDNNAAFGFDAAVLCGFSHWSGCLMNNKFYQNA